MRSVGFGILYDDKVAGCYQCVYHGAAASVRAASRVLNRTCFEARLGDNRSALGWRLVCCGRALDGSLVVDNIDEDSFSQLQEYVRDVGQLLKGFGYTQHPDPSQSLFASLPFTIVQPTVI